MPETPPATPGSDAGNNLRVRIERGLPYDTALAMQLEWVNELKRDPHARPVLLMVEHTPVITLGRSTAPASLTASRDRLHALGIEVYESRRGGDVTYHGPGQWTAYPILRLKEICPDLHRYMRMLEEVTIRFLAGRGIKGVRVDGKTGVWVEGGEQRTVPRKIAAVGIAVTGWISYHGTAVNITPDLAPFRDLMVPCGIDVREGGVTSLAELTERDYDETDMHTAAQDWINGFADVFGLQPR